MEDDPVILKLHREEKAMYIKNAGEIFLPNPDEIADAAYLLESKWRMALDIES